MRCWRETLIITYLDGRGNVSVKGHLSIYNQYITLFILTRGCSLCFETSVSTFPCPEKQKCGVNPWICGAIWMGPQLD
jgi:hypothetical protein